MLADRRYVLQGFGAYERIVGEVNSQLHRASCQQHEFRFLDRGFNAHPNKVVESRRSAIVTKAQGIEDIQDVSAVKANLDVVMDAVCSDYALTYES